MRVPPQRIRIDTEAVMPHLRRIFESGQLAYGPKVKLFERRWSEVCEQPYTVAVNSCTSALEIAIRSLHIPKKSKIAVPTNTYGATVQACWNAGYDVHLVDIEEDLNMNIDKIDWREDIGAVIMVMIGGNGSGRLAPLEEICEHEGVPLIIDGAHAHCVPEATQYGDVTAFSFYATKLITTMGEGGAIVTDRADVDAFARAYRHHGRVDHNMEWDHCMSGANMCMTEAQAIVGLDQIKKLPTFIKNRKKVADIYDEKFDPIYDYNGNYYKYVVPGRPKVLSKDITLPSPVYRKPIHQHTFWKGKGKYPVADEVCENHFCLPMYNDMKPEECLFVRDNVEVV